MISLFIPNKKNKFTPYLLRKMALLFYVALVIGFNLFLSFSKTAVVSADITTQDLLIAHNLEREKEGLAPLTLNTTLSVSAKNKGEAMLSANCWSHYCPDGKSPWDFFLDSGYEYEYAGENLAEGFSNADSVMSAWLNSPTHKENILNPNFSEVGFSFISGNYQGKSNNLLVVVHFGRQIAGTAIQGTIEKTENSAGSITIDNLKEGDILNQQFIEVEGQIQPEEFNVDIYFNNEAVGRVVADGSNYSYRSARTLDDGLYRVYASIVSDVIDIESEKILVRVDGAIPQLVTDSVVAYQTSEDRLVLEFKTTNDVLKITSKLKVDEITEYDDNSWKIAIPTELAKQTNELKLTLEDFSGNTNDFKIDLVEISKEAEQLFSKNNNQILKQSVPQKFISRIANSNLQTVFPILFIIFLASLFLIDFFVLIKTDMIHQVKRKPHAQISVLLVLFITIVVGGAGGSILNGVQV